MSDIVDEAEIDHKEYKKVMYFKKALPYVLVVTLFIVIGMIIYEYRSSNAKAHNMDMGDLIIDSINNLPNDPNVAIEGLKYAVQNSKNYAKDIAALQIASINIAGGRKAEALEAIENILKDGDYNILTMSYAKLMWISIKLDDKKIASEDKDVMNKYFASFQKKSPFYGSAKILEALFLQKEGKKSEAVEIVKAMVSDDTLPNGVRNEADALLSNLNN